jgi:hypothetical protein
MFTFLGLLLTVWFTLEVFELNYFVRLLFVYFELFWNKNGLANTLSYIFLSYISWYFYAYLLFIFLTGYLFFFLETSWERSFVRLSLYFMVCLINLANIFCFCFLYFSSLSFMNASWCFSSIFRWVNSSIFSNFFVVGIII